MNAIPEKTLSCAARYGNLAQISGFVTEFAKSAGLDDATCYDIQMAVDEACANIIEHAYGGEDYGEIKCTCCDEPQQLIITLRDQGKAFDPQEVQLPDTHASIEDRPIGGLGLFFMRQLMDEVHFEFIPATDDQPATNVLTLVKRKESSPASTHEALRQRAEHLTLVAEVSHAIISILDLDNLLTTVVNLVSRRLNYPYVQIYTVHPGRRKVFYEVGNLPDNQQLKQEHFAYDLDDPQGIIPWVARSGIAVIANDVTSEPRYRLSQGMPASEVRSELTIPLVFGSDVLGILDVQSNHANAFREDDRALLGALGANIAIALRNANLFHAEAWRRRVADGMREVAGLLSADADLHDVLDSILAELKQNLPCEAAAIWLLNESDGAGDPSDDELSNLELAAFHAPDAAISLDELSFPPGPWLESVLIALEPITRTVDSPYEFLGQSLNFPEDYSAVAAPLRIGERCLGALELVHSTPNRYGSEARTVTATFASYAAVAIENTRLYEASHEQAWVATVLLQVAEAAQSEGDIPGLLEQIAQIATLLVGVDACAFWLWDSHSEMFVPAKSAGLGPAAQETFWSAPIAVDSFSAFEQVRLEHKTAVLDDRYFDSFKSNPESANILFPLFTHGGEVLGALLAGFHSIEAALREDNLAIIQGIAHQAATAIENIRLLRSQREEAYISVALLQVAQAIVSLNELDEILETITRIIPILAGVRRSGVFLYDEQRHSFWLANRYELDVDDVDGVITFQPVDFPLLEAVWKHNRLFFLHSNNVDRLADWAEQEALPGQSLTAKNSQENQTHEPLYERDLLMARERLVLAFPLSVKGRKLGILVAEEADAHSDESIAAVRARRLEIMTGITQQVSLAIQNDRLQHEVLERERLERELQLARQIQQTFLPEVLPHLDGWELSVRWRTARQVGGDFYDVFELPNGRIGLVIADVADKGMPAALFMTLVRTLIRAAVRELASPAVVLERVNELLIPDTRNGMFVTVVYAVLTAATGELIYANAGHNPPLLLQSANGEVQRLLTGGMALGIMENIHIPERSIILEPGDFLVFYTDGITEAFSPSNEMYGEDRLHMLLRATHNRGDIHAKDVLDTIDISVDSFTHAEDPSDDVTMIAVLRG
jgi:serine phosphatase RsbU (regulator of sigma subunit)/anti-sigma regulatory factor (Ser/Thr protein kinase)